MTIIIVGLFNAHLILSTEVTVILFVEVVVGVIAIVAGFGFKHTYVVGGNHDFEHIQLMYNILCSC